MTQHYLQARSIGWLPPLAIVIAGYRCRSGLAAAVRSVNPAGAVVLFVAGYVAALVSPLAALAVVAFLAGLYLATRVVTVESSQPATTIDSALPVDHDVEQAQMRKALAVINNLDVQSITFKKPAKPAAVKNQ